MSSVPDPTTSLRVRCETILRRVEAFPYTHSPLENALHTVRGLYGHYLNTLESIGDRQEAKGNVMRLPAPSTTVFASSSHVAVKQPRFLYDTGILEQHMSSFLEKHLGEVKSIIETCEQQQMFSHALFKRLKTVYDEGMTFKDRFEQDSTPQESAQLQDTWNMFREQMPMLDAEEEEALIVEGEDEEIILEEEDDDVIMIM